MSDNKEKSSTSVKSNPNKKTKKKSKISKYFRKLKLIFKELFSVKKSDDDTASKSNLEIVKGSRKRKRTVRIVFYALVLALIVTVIVVSALSPTGLIEKIQNSYVARGKGELPVNVYAQNPDEMVTNGDVISILNDTYLEVFNTNGKLINAFSHGMFNPCLETSEARFLLFDRDRYSVKVFNYSSELYSRTFDKNIYSADIGRNGTYAVVTTSDAYKNTVYVYNKSDEQIFCWNSAEYYVTDVVVANNGKSIGVCLVDASAGSFVSHVYILDYKSATPVYKVKFDTLVSSLSSVNQNYFVANGVDSVYVLNWEGSCSELDFNGVVRYFSTDVNGNSCFAVGREDNEQMNSIIIIGEEGSVLADFEFNAPISDVCVSTEKVLVLSNNSVFIYDTLGVLETELKSDTKPLFAVLNKNNEPLVIDNSQLKILKSLQE